MRSRVSRIVLTAKLSSLVVLSILTGTLLVGYAAYAEDTQIKVAVSGSNAPNLELDNISSPVTVTQMPLVITGTVDNLTQIQVYVDGFYSSTIPLTPSATTFSYSLNLSSGSHTVQFLGISAYTSNNPSVTITVIYTPSVVTPPTSDGGGAGTTAPGTGGVTIGGQQLPNLNAPNQLLIPIPQWLYKTLVFFDILNPNKPNDTAVMLWRFLLVLLGLFFVVFARLVLAFYRWLRYRVLYWNKHPLGRVLRDHPLFWIRLIGIAMIVAVFILL